MMALLQGVRLCVRWASLALLALLVITPLVQIVMRGVFNLPFGGAEELARYFLICLTFIGASYVTVEGGQIRMEEFQAFLPARPRWLLQLVIESCGVLLFAFLCGAAVVTISRNLENRTATLEMPFVYFMAPLALGAALLCIETAVILVRTARSGHAHQKQTTLT